MALRLLPSTLAKLDRPGSQTYPLLIQEVAGPRRSIELRGKSLPTGLLEAGVEQRGEIDHYPGNPVGSLQVMGPTFLPTLLEGRWDDYHLNDDDSYAKLGFFPAVAPAGSTGSLTTGGASFQSGGAVPTGEARRARTLRDAMMKLAKTGMLLRVSWASISRYGIIKRFVPRHSLEESLEWELEFIWIGDTSATPKPRISASTDKLSVLQAILGALREVLNGINLALALAFGALDQLVNPFAELTTLTEDFLIAAEDLTNLAFTPQDLLAQLKQQLTAIKLKAFEVKRVARSRAAGYEAALEGRSPADIAAAETAQRAAVASLIAMAADADRGVANIDELLVPDVIGFYLTTGAETLRDIARQFGFPAETGWKTIRDFNGLSSSIVPAGLRILIPREGSGLGAS